MRAIVLCEAYAMIYLAAACLVAARITTSVFSCLFKIMPKLVCLSVAAEGELKSGYYIDVKNEFRNLNLVSVIIAIFDKIKVVADSSHADLIIFVTEWCANCAQYYIDPTRTDGRLG